MKCAAVNKCTVSHTKSVHLSQLGHGRNEITIMPRSATRVAQAVTMVGLALALERLPIYDLRSDQTHSALTWCQIQHLSRDAVA